MSSTPPQDATHTNTAEASFRMVGVVVHSTVGRLRLRVPYLFQDAAWAPRLEQQIRSLTFVEAVQINTAAASLTITYTASVFAEHSLPQHPPLRLLESIQQVSQLHIKGTEAIAGNDLLNIDLKEAQLQLRRVGGGLLGGFAGDVIGGSLGATAGAIVLGPAGAIWGAQLGVFVGGVLGAQIGAEAIYQLDQVANDARAGLTPQQMAETLQRRAGEKIGETTGQVVGGVVGRVMLGPTGQIVGAIVGGALGGQMGEDTFSKPHTIDAKNDANNRPERSPGALEETQQWLTRTTQKFVGETATITVGAAVGRMVLGPAGHQVGLKIGNRISKMIEWAPRDIYQTTANIENGTVNSTVSEIRIDENLSLDLTPDDTSNSISSDLTIELQEHEDPTAKKS